MARNYAALPHEYLEEMADLTDAEFGRLIRALLIYSKTGREEALNGGERYLWRRVRNQEDRFQESYDSASNAKSEAGKKGATKRWQRMAQDGRAMADDGRAWQPMAEHGKNGYTETNTETETETETILPLAIASREGANAHTREASGSLPKKKYGQYVWLDFHEFSELLNKLGHPEMSRRMKLVDLPQNEGKDFYELIMGVSE